MKQITAERIKRALAKVDEARGKRCRDDRKVVSTLAGYGMKVLIGGVDSVDRDRTDLDLTYLEAPKDREGLEAVMDRFYYNIDRFHKKSQAIYRIQERYQVSGLIEVVSVLGGEEIHHLGEDEELQLLPSDLPLMAESKTRLAIAWLNYSQSLNYEFWGRIDKDDRDDWKPITVDKFLALVPQYDWAHLWESVQWHSEQSLREKGYSNLSSIPSDRLPDKRHEIHLTLGSGTDTTSCHSDQIWLCACNVKPSL